jgi:glycosyltransferase involved in cell wall biosynthesis
MAAVAGWYRRWMDQHRRGERTEMYLDDQSSGVPGRIDFEQSSIAIPRLLPRWQVPQFVAARRRVGAGCPAFDEVHIVGASSVHGWSAPATGQSLIWLATTVADERQPLLPALDFFRRQSYRATLPVLRRMEETTLRRATRVLAMSPHTARAVEAAGVPRHRIDVLPVPIDTDAIRPRPDVQRRGVLFVGRAHDPRKGFDRVVALARSSAAVATPGVDVVSGGPDLTPPSLRGVVRWWGNVDDLAARYAQAQVFVLTSLQEGLGIVAFEALAAGTPVVAFRCGGADDFLEASGGAILVDSVAELRSATERLLGDAGLAADMGSGGREWVHEHMAAHQFLGEPNLFRV